MNELDIKILKLEAEIEGLREVVKYLKEVMDTATNPFLNPNTTVFPDVQAAKTEYIKPTWITTQQAPVINDQYYITNCSTTYGTASTSFNRQHLSVPKF